MRAQNIVVIGGGIGGLTAAIALLQAGFAVTLLESAPEFGEIGAGVTLSPNAMRGFDYIGLGEAIAAAGVEPSRQRIQHWADGRTLHSIDRSGTRAKYAAAYVYIHRADLHAILVCAAIAAGGVLRTGAAAISVDATGAHLTDGSVVAGDVIVGADGLKSVVRRLFESAQAHFTGHVAWRGLAPVTPELADLASFPGVHIGPGRMVTRYPVRGGSLLNMVFFARANGWTEDGWSIPSTHADLETTFDGWCPEVMAMIAAAPEKSLFKWAINARTPLENWVIDDRIVLMGDAAHAMTPFLGQGAACAIEDAIVLSRALSKSATTSEGLARYVAARHDRTSFVQAESNANAERMQGDDSDLFGLTKMVNEETLGLFNYDCRTAAI